MNKKTYRLPKRKDGQRTFDQIIETGKRLFSKQGYVATSINEIIDEAGIATGTFYLYFDDKLALYSYILLEYHHSIRKHINEKIKNVHTRYEKERLGIKAFLQLAWDDPLVYKIIWESMFIDETLFRDYYVTFSQDYIRSLNHSVDRDEVRDDIDLETLSYILMGISNFVGLQVLFRDTLIEHKLDEIVDNVMKVLESGMFIKK